MSAAKIDTEKNKGRVDFKLICLLCAATIPTVSEAHSKNTDEQGQRISTRILKALSEANGVPGMAAAVWHDGKMVWTGEVGYRDAEKRLPVEANTIFRFASVSKIFAFTAAARLREQGRLDVDLPVQQTLDYLNPKWPPLTSRQLAAHTAGIPHYQAVDLGRGSINYESIREAVGVFSDRELLFAPGSAYNYSSYGYTLLSAVVEKTSGEPYLEYLTREIVPGLAIVPDATGSDPSASKAYDYESGKLAPSAPHNFSYSWGGAGMSGTAPDLARFGGNMLAGKIVSHATFEWMMEPTKLNNGASVSERDYTVGFGLRSGKDLDGERVAHHAGVTQGARSVLLFYPDQKFAISILSNAPWISAIEQTAITLSAPMRSQKGAVIRACPVKASRYEGIYDGKSVNGSASFTFENGICSGKISAAAPIASWFDSSSRKDVRSIEIIGTDRQGGLGQAAFVTPFGAYDLRPSTASNRHIVSLGGSRLFDLEFR